MERLRCTPFEIALILPVYDQNPDQRRFKGFKRLSLAGALYLIRNLKGAPISHVLVEIACEPCHCRFNCRNYPERKDRPS